MGLIEYNGAVVHGNFSKLKKRRPKNWVHKDYKIVIPYKFKFRAKIGKVECTCSHCEEHYMPYYGWSWYHMEDCAYVQHFKKYPGILNLNNFYGFDYRMIAQTE